MLSFQQGRMTASAYAKDSITPTMADQVRYQCHGAPILLLKGGVILVCPG